MCSKYKSLIRYIICKYFLPFCVLSFIVLIIFVEQKFFIVMKFSFIFLFLLSLRVLVLYLRRLSLRGALFKHLMLSLPSCLLTNQLIWDCLKCFSNFIYFYLPSCLLTNQLIWDCLKCFSNFIYF